jgi:hypothetical protein
VGGYVQTETGPDRLATVRVETPTRAGNSYGRVSVAREDARPESATPKRPRAQARHEGTPAHALQPGRHALPEPHRSAGSSHRRHATPTAAGSRATRSLPRCQAGAVPISPECQEREIAEVISAIQVGGCQAVPNRGRSGVGLLRVFEFTCYWCAAELPNCGDALRRRAACDVRRAWLPR